MALNLDVNSEFLVLNPYTSFYNTAYRGQEPIESAAFRCPYPLYKDSPLAKTLQKSVQARAQSRSIVLKKEEKLTRPARRTHLRPAHHVHVPEIPISGLARLGITTIHTHRFRVCRLEAQAHGVQRPVKIHER